MGIGQYAFHKMRQSIHFDYIHMNHNLMKYLHSQTRKQTKNIGISYLRVFSSSSASIIIIDNNS